VNRTDLHILELLSRQGPSSASELTALAQAWIAELKGYGYEAARISG